MSKNVKELKLTMVSKAQEPGESEEEAFGGAPDWRGEEK